MSTIVQRLILFNFLIVVYCNQTTGQKTVKEQILWTADWSPNDKYIAVGGNVDTLKIFHGETMKLHKSIPVKNTITRVKWHPSFNIAAVGTQMSSDKSFLYNFDTDEKMELSGIAMEGARGLAWNFTGEYLAIGDNDGQILIYDLSGTLQKTFVNETTKSITALDWHPQKNLLTTVSDRIRFFDMEGNLINSVKHRSEDVLLLCIAWHRSGDFFVTGDYGNGSDRSLLQYWDQTCELLHAHDISNGEFRNLVWDPRGTRLATASDALRIWDEAGNLISEGLSEEFLWGLSWNKWGDRIITTSMKQKIELWNDKAERLMKID